jgi:unsaturated chondroitin disaccharide hydrolase
MKRTLLGSILTLFALAGPITSSLASADLDRLVGRATEVSLQRLERSTREAGTPDKYPTYGTKDLRWQLRSSADWTSGFYPGCLWFAYELGGDARFAAWARDWTAGIEHEKTNRDTHDLGFRFMCTYGQALRLEPGVDQAAREAVLHEAARTLGARFNPRIGALSSNWDQNPPAGSFPVVIDIMMNLELLLWSAEHGGPKDLAAHAREHADVNIRDLMRPDGGTYHVVRYRLDDGSVLNKGTLQGAGAETTWSRGQAWAQYGMVVMYRYTREPRYLEAARRLTDYFLNHLPEDHVSAWDFQSDINYRDVSATAIVASGLFEMIGFIDDAAVRARYRQAAERMLGSLCQPPYFAAGDTNCLLDHSVQYLPINSNVDVPAIFADYYFLEAVLRYRALRAAER